MRTGLRFAPRESGEYHLRTLIDTIIFDAEGVIVDTEPIWDKAQEEFLRQRGFVYNREKTKPFLAGRSMVEGVRIMQEQYGFSGDLQKQGEERVSLVKLLLAKELKFIPGFVEFFAQVRDKYKTCVATSMAKDLLAIVDSRLHLSSLFGDKIFTCADVGFRSKPQPDLFLYAARQLGSAPENCIVIEDSPNGIEAASRAGMKSIGITTTFEAKILRGAGTIVSSFSEIDLSLWARAATPPASNVRVLG